MTRVFLPAGWTGQWLRWFGRKARTREAQFLEKLKVLDDLVSDSGAVHGSGNAVGAPAAVDLSVMLETAWQGINRAARLA